jgi:2-phospho-L-lactate guanylyltransferase
MVKVAVLIPMKGSDKVKSRLSGTLSRCQRITLANNLLNRVVSAAKGSQVSSITVVGGGSLSREIARKFSVDWVETQGIDLNLELMNSVEVKKSQGFASIYLPGDLPFVKSSDVNKVIAGSNSGSQMVFVPSSSDGGTNCMLIPSYFDFPTLLGEDSLSKHCQAARVKDLGFIVLESTGMSIDLDTEVDLERCEVLEPGFRARLGEPLVGR